MTAAAMTEEAGFARPNMASVARRQLNLSIAMLAVVVAGMIGVLLSAAPSGPHSAASQIATLAAQPG